MTLIRLRKKKRKTSENNNALGEVKNNRLNVNEKENVRDKIFQTRKILQTKKDNNLNPLSEEEDE